jgi:hypothetical protein
VDPKDTPDPLPDPEGPAPGDGDPGPRAARYEFREPVVREGDEVLWDGRDASLERDISLRVLGGDSPPAPEAVRSFVERARASGRLQHPGVVPVYELSVREDGRPFVALKKMRGETMDAVLARPGERHRLLPAVEQLCQAIAYAHARGVVHGRLAPRCVILGTFGEVQVGGFTGTGAAGDDVRALGRILSAALSGAPGEEALAEVAGKCAGSAPPAASEVARLVAEHLGAAKSRAHRASLRALEERAEAERARDRAALAEGQAAAARKARRQIRSIAAAVLLVVAVAVAGTLWAMGRQEERSRKARAVLEEALAEATRELARGRTRPAILASERAVSLAGDDLVREDQRRAASTVHSEALRRLADQKAAAAEEARRSSFLARLADARVRRPRAGPEEASAAFREAFAAYGLDPADAEAVRRDPLAASILPALGEAARLPDPEWTRLARAAAAGTPVGEVLDAAATGGVDALLALASAHPQHEALALLAGLLADRGEAGEAERLLSAAWVRAPGDAWIHLELAELYLAQAAPDAKRAARHLSATAAVLPACAPLARLLENTLAR